MWYGKNICSRQEDWDEGINPDFEVKNSYKQVNEEKFEPLDFDLEYIVGSEGKGVLAIEQRLEVLGYMDEADEVFTEETMDAVQEYKAYNGMLPLAVVDFDLIAYLNNVEYNKMYIEVDKQLEAATKYLEELD